MVRLTAIVKLVEDVAVLPPTVTVIGPVVAPTGTVVMIWVEVQLVTAAAVPLNLTALLAGVVLKFVPVMVIVSLTWPLVGVKLVIVGTVLTAIVKLVEDVAVLPPTVTVIGPVVVPAGTVVMIWVEVQLVTTAAVPLKLTALLAGVVLKFVPVMLMVSLTWPLVGVKLVIVGRFAGSFESPLLPPPQPEIMRMIPRKRMTRNNLLDVTAFLFIMPPQ
jgi:hypothetical protein